MDHIRTRVRVSHRVFVRRHWTLDTPPPGPVTWCRVALRPRPEAASSCRGGGAARGQGARLAYTYRTAHRRPILYVVTCSGTSKGARKSTYESERRRETAQQGRGDGGAASWRLERWRGGLDYKGLMCVSCKRTTLWWCDIGDETNTMVKAR